MAPEPLTAPRKERRRLVTPGRIVAASVTLLGVLAPFVGAAETDIPLQAWVFIVCNVVIFSSYAFVAVFIAPLFPVRMPALVGAFGFFLFCGLTHFDMVFHTLFYRDRMWGDLVLDAHMLMVHIPQAIFVVVFAALRLRQSVSRLQALGLVAAFAGIAVVASGRGDAASAATQTTLAGAMLVLLSAVTIAFYYVWSVELSDQYGTATVAAWSTLFGFIAVLPWAIWEMSHTPVQLTPTGIGAALYLGVMVTVAGLFLWLHLLRTVPARIAASIQYLQPIIGVATAAVMFGDELGPLFIAGVLLVLAGLTLTVTTRRKGAS